jgi:hypothetical protein
MTERLTADQIERIARRRRFAVRTLHIASRVLVDGASVEVVAAEFGLCAMQVRRMSRTILQAVLPEAGAWPKSATAAFRRDGSRPVPWKASNL